MPYKDKEKQKEYQKKWDAKNYEKKRIKQKERLVEVRKRNKLIIEEYKSSGCIVCNESRIPCLVLHHRNPEEKDYKITAMGRASYSVNTIKKELNKCDVMCSNCHLILHRELESG